MHARGPDAVGIEATLRDVTSHEIYGADERMAVTTAGGIIRP